MKKIALFIISLLMVILCSSCSILFYTIDVMGTGLIGAWGNSSSILDESSDSAKPGDSSDLSESIDPSNSSDAKDSSNSSDSSTEQKEEKTFKVTFQQLGYPNVVVTVKQGETLSDIPGTQNRTGYTVTWKAVDLTNIQKDILVQANETPNVYTVTYNANGGELSTLTEQITFDSEVSLPVPTRAGYDFAGWTHNGKSVTNGKWTIAEDITLDAQYVEIIPEYITVTFNRAGEDPVSFELLKGESLNASDYPVLEQKTGYIIAWDKTLEELTNLTENVTVTAVETPKTYTIVLDTNGGTLEDTTFTVTYGEKYTLPIPTRLPEGATNYTFTGWTYNGEKVSLTGLWQLDEDGREYVAQWTTDEWSGWY